MGNIKREDFQCKTRKKIKTNPYIFSWTDFAL